MEISALQTRPQAPPQPQSPATPSQTASVATDLPEARTVAAISSVNRGVPNPQSASKSELHLNEPDQTPRGTETTKPDARRRQTVMDWSTNQPVFRVVDERSGQVISQMPDQALLRLRAYAKQQNMADTVTGRTLSP